MFESHAGVLSVDQFQEFSVSYLKQISQRVRQELTQRKIKPVPMVSWTIQCCVGTSSDPCWKPPKDAKRPLKAFIRNPTQCLNNDAYTKIAYTVPMKKNLPDELLVRQIFHCRVSVIPFLVVAMKSLCRKSYLLQYCYVALSSKTAKIEIIDHCRTSKTQSFHSIGTSVTVQSTFLTSYQMTK